MTSDQQDKLFQRFAQAINRPRAAMAETTSALRFWLGRIAGWTRVAPGRRDKD
jgi:hypothetical protein